MKTSKEPNVRKMIVGGGISWWFVIGDPERTQYQTMIPYKSESVARRRARELYGYSRLAKQK